MSNRWRSLTWEQTRKDYSYMPSLRSGPPLLSEQQGWGIYTTTNTAGREANMLVHLACGRGYPNWWLAPDIMDGALQDPEITCVDCQAKLPIEAYHIFWGAYRLLNMSRDVSRR